MTDLTTRREIMRRLREPLKFTWHAHGIGMLRTYLDEEQQVRLNVWHSLLLNPGISTMHTHPRPFTSDVYAGMMVNRIYKRVERGGEPYREGIIHCGSAFKGIEGEPKPVLLRRTSSTELLRHARYTTLPDVIHDTRFANGTVTVMTWDRSTPDTCASVFWPEGKEWGDATRHIDPDEIDIVCKLALARMEMGQ